MKLSEVKGTRNLEIIADIIEPLGNIAMDKRYKGVFPIGIPNFGFSAINESKNN